MSDKTSGQGKIDAIELLVKNLFDAALKNNLDWRQDDQEKEKEIKDQEFD